MSSKQYFNQVANEWDSIRKGFFSNAVREKALEIACVEKNKLAADIGAGTGFITEELVKYDLRVIVVDESESMIKAMEKKFEDIESIEFRNGESDNLPISTNQVDYAFANMYLHHVGSPQSAINEMARILKPGGKLVITDLDEHDFEFLKKEHHDRWMGFKRQDIIKWFSNAGLKDVKVDCIGEKCCAQSNCGCDNASISIFVASGIK